MPLSGYLSAITLSPPSCTTSISFTIGPLLSPLCASQVDIMVHTADRLGIPLAPDKHEGPTSRLVFLGVMIDSNLMECSLPPDKLSELVTEALSTHIQILLNPYTFLSRYAFCPHASGESDLPFRKLLNPLSRVKNI